MILGRKLRLFKDAKEIIFRYIEASFPITDTAVAIYDTYKLNIMLSDGLAAILNERNEIYNSFSGDLFFFNPDEIHHGRILRQGVHKYIEILIPTEFFPDCESYSALFNDSSKQRTNILSPAPKERELILSLAEKMINSARDTDDDILFLSHLIELLKICTSLYNRNETDTNYNIPATLRNAITFIQREYSGNIQITDIATASNCSTSYLSRIFNKHVGKSPYGYLTEYRLFIAEKLLRNGYSVTDAASMSGFCDSSSFIKCFKKSFGTTPLKYQKTHSC